MKPRFYSLLLACIIIFAACNNKSDNNRTMNDTAGIGSKEKIQAEQHSAIANISGVGGNDITGKATFTEENGKVTLVVNLQKAGAAGERAIHIHEFGDCSAHDGSSAGAHWNPTMDSHGKWGSAHFHRGDIGNITIGADGTGTLTVTTDLWTISGSDTTKNIVGKSVIIHSGKDDFTSQPSGNSGNRIGCGTIEKQ